MPIIENTITFIWLGMSACVARHIRWNLPQYRSRDFLYISNCEDLTGLLDTRIPDLNEGVSQLNLDDSAQR